MGQFRGEEDRVKLGTHHAIFVGTTIVVCRDDGRRSSNDPHTPCDDRRMTAHTLHDGCWLHTRRPTTVEADSEPGGYLLYQYHTVLPPSVIFSHSATMAVLSKHAIFCIAAYALIRRKLEFGDNLIVKLYLDITFLFELIFFNLIFFLLF